MKTEPLYVFDVSLLKILSTDITHTITHLVAPAQCWYLDNTFEHDKCANSVCFDLSGKLLVTASSDKEIRIFTRYDDYTIEQLLLKNTLLNWLLIESQTNK